MTRKDPHAVHLGRKGGKAKTPAKAKAARANAKKGRPHPFNGPKGGRCRVCGHTKRGALGLHYRRV